MKFNDGFEEAAFKERIFFNGLRNKFNLFPEENWTIDETHYTNYTKYDYMIHSKKEIKRYIVEIKVRTDNYENYIYESKKHISLSAIKNIDETRNTIIYINSTPQGTYIWNIDKIIHKYKPILKEMNIATMRSRTEKEDKRVYLLKPEDAKFVDYTYDQKDFIKIMAEYKRKEDEKKKPKSRGLDFLFE